jgi:hypothetical protein
MPEVDDTIYPGGFANLMRFLEKRQRRFDDVDSVLPASDVALDALYARTVPAPEMDYNDAIRFTAHRKWLELQQEFQGQSQLFHLHAMLISISRRDDPPAVAIDLFCRMWREQGLVMARELPVRWLISAATTFADCGQTGDQRALGMGLSLLFDLVKLHDSERRGLGLAGDATDTLVPGRDRPPLGLDMAPYSFHKGDVDKVMLARLWQLAERDATIRPLATRMLRIVMQDRRTIFARAQTLKSIKDTRR